MNLIIYTKSGCHLCEGLLEKLESIKQPHWTIEVRPIESRADWLAQYEYEVPVLYQRLDSGQEEIIPRPSPRLSASGLQNFLGKYA